MPQIEEKHVVLISREFTAGAPIKIDVTHEGIGISMTLNDFLDALSDATGNPAAILTKAQLRSRLAIAAVAVTDAMKRETARVM
jgi:hypothetical protein